MLFNSYIFIFLFLPITLIVFYWLGTYNNNRAAVTWLVTASLFFYAWWNPAYILMLIGSILFNFSLGKKLNKNDDQVDAKKSIARSLLIAGITVNLAVLGYFKYANFFIETTNALFSNSFHLNNIILPLAISFFTFQQITYLVDAYKGITREYSFLHYCLFVVYFPQLIAGPIVHHKEMMPQFAKTSVYKISHDRIAIGMAIFIIGLFKKVVIADSIALYSTPMFDAAHEGVTISFFEAWSGALSYTFQLYFDFSGYSDMAVGLAYMFGIRLALNFFSPYKANNIREFWQRWHITLSRFLRDYLYIPLGGNRKGSARRHANIMITMLLGGLWHGAGWTFVAWGALHGIYLVINNTWQIIMGRFRRRTWWGKVAARLLTFLAVVVAWVFFRAENFSTAVEIIRAMIGANGVVLPPSYIDYLNQLFSLGNALQTLGFRFEDNVPYFGGLIQIASLTLLFTIVWIAPNTYQLFTIKSPYIDSTSVAHDSKNRFSIKWRPTTANAIVMSIFLLIVIFKIDSTSEFLYFQF